MKFATIFRIFALGILLVSCGATELGKFSISSVKSSDQQVTLEWTDSANALNYQIRYGTNSREFTTIATKKATSPYPVTGLANGTKYYFMVTAENGLLTLDANEEVSATPSSSTAAAPSLVSLTPSNQYVTSSAVSVVATFDKSVSALSASNFVITGNCTTPPTVSSVTMSAGDTVATASLAGGTCSDGQTVIVSVDPTTVNSSSVAGTGSVLSRTYTVSTTGPTVTLGTPSSVSMFSTDSVTIALSFADSIAAGTALTGNLTAIGGGVTYTALSGTPTCNIAVGGITTAGATVTLSGCSGVGTANITVDAGILQDSLGNLSAASSASATITITAVKRIFVTTSTFNGNLGGLSGADSKCNVDANKPSGSSSTYKALLNGNNATSTGVAYYRSNGTTLIATATGGNLLGSSALTNAINASAANVWTGATSNCSTWSSNSGAVNGTIGSAASSSATYWSASSPNCSGSRSLYCVEQ